MSELDDCPSGSHRHDAVLTSCLHGLLAALLSAIWRRAVVVHFSVALSQGLGGVEEMKGK